MKRHGRAGDIVTDGLRFYRATSEAIGPVEKQVVGLWESDRATNSHQPFRRRESATLRFRPLRSLQTLVSVHSAARNHFRAERTLPSCTIYKQARGAALTE